MEIQASLVTFLTLAVYVAHCHESDLTAPEPASAVIINSKADYSDSMTSEPVNHHHQLWSSNLVRSDALQQEISTQCRTMLDDFSAASTQFLSCVLDNGRPLHYCEKCYLLYINVTFRYDRIENDTGKTPGPNCNAKILQGDYMQVVRLSYEQIENIWEQSACDQCFVIDSGNKYNYIVKNDTKEMMGKIEDTLECFDDFPAKHPHNSSDLCTYCHNVYFAANDLYLKIKKKKGLCSDLVDAMNHTRLTWGNTTNQCSLAVKDSGEIWGITAIMLALPIFLYVGAWLHTKYVLNDSLSLDGMQEPLLETPG